MINVTNLSIETLKGRKLIENLSFTLNAGDKLAVIGEEGNGKSTLLKAICDQKLIENFCSVKGNIDKSKEVIGYLEQKLAIEWHDCTIEEYFLKDTPQSDVDYSNYDKFDKVKRKMKDFGFSEDVFDENKKIGTLSGGEQVKLQLVKILSNEPTCLFLDEPTNDLDINTLIWLEKFINNYKKPLIFISHDEMLLENCANKILHIEQLIRKSKPKHTLAVCGYAEYVGARQESIRKQTQIAYSERREKEKKEEILRQIKQKVENSLNASKKDPSNGRIVAKKMANIKAQERKLDEEELTEIPDVEEAINMLIDGDLTIPKQKQVLNLNMDKLYAGDKLLSKNVQLKIFGPERIAIIGDNGCGKSTLIKQLVPILKSVSGLKVGYFSQNYNESMDYESTPVNEINESNGEVNARTLLGCMKFTPEEMEHKIKDLSEGQKAKILLMKLIVERNNVLVLDEPTRNLSPLSNPVIRKMLNSYNGAIITVSHDRRFIESVCEKVYELSKEGLTPISFKKKDKINELVL